MVEWMCLDFLNSDWRDWRGSGRREDRLDNLEWMRAFLERWGLEAPLPVDPVSREALGELRGRMRAIVEALAAGQPLGEGDVDVVNQALEEIPARMRLAVDGNGCRLEQVVLAQGWTLVAGRIAASFAELVTGEDIRRIKICANDDCRWVFFDESRNRARRWCDDRMCGNLMKVRRFRERQKTKGTGR